MEKCQLLDVISVTKEDIKKLENIRKEYRQYHKPFVDITNLPIRLKIIIGLILFYFISLFIYPIVAASVVISESLAQILLFILPFSAIFVTFFLYAYLVNKTNLYQINRNIKRNSNRIDEIIEEELKIMDFLKGMNLPLNYCYTRAIEQFENYLLNYRADTLKECINLFESEEKHQAQIHELRTIQQIQDLVYKEARAAKNIALLNLFTRR